MASSVYYKFRSQRDESKVSFDGTGISVFDLKKEIILANNLKANDFDLLLLNPQTNEEYKDDTEIVPRSSQVIAKRVPAARPGKGKGAMYVSGVTPAIDSSSAKDKQQVTSAPIRSRAGMGSMSKRFDGKEDAPKPRSSTPTIPSSAVVTNDDEAAAMAAMFKAQTDVWEETQEKMSHAVPIYNNTRGTTRGRPFVARAPTHHQHQPDRPLPPSYVCYRCGQKGHWIHDCPTNNDREYDNRPRIKRTTGIPRSFLKSVEQPSEGKVAQGVMVTPDGGYVVAQPDLESWQKQVARSKALAADVREKAPSDPTLACPIDSKLFLNAVKTPCCGTTYCEECVQTHLLENNFICPKCSKKVASLDKLVIDKPMRTRVGDYIDKVVKEENDAVEAALRTGDKSTNEETKEDEDDPNAGIDEVSFDQQPGSNFDISQLVSESIPQLQAQLQQLSVMLQNPNLPMHVRQSTEFQYQQTQMQMQQAQAVASLAADMSAAAAAAAAAQFQQLQQLQQQHQQNSGNMNQGFTPNQWQTQFSNQQPAGQDSAYQRLPVSNRRRSNKRERPSDFLEIGGNDGNGSEVKMARYWE